MGCLSRGGAALRLVSSGAKGGRIWLTQGAQEVYVECMKHRSISFSEIQIAYLDTAAKQLGISIGELVRRIIDEHRTREQTKETPS